MAAGVCNRVIHFNGMHCETQWFYEQLAERPFTGVLGPRIRDALKKTREAGQWSLSELKATRRVHSVKSFY